MKTLNFVIVGHVDHGKSTLIGRLLYDTKSLPPDKIAEIEKASKNLGRTTEFAYLLDHLEEERQQGITIDTTQVFFKTAQRHYVIIDAPGHVEFVKNMITGASQAEAAVLIVDANEGLKEQTRRHAYMLSLLGLKQVIVVLNKMDLVQFSQDKFNQVKEEVSQFLESIKIKPLYYIPISAIAGANIATKAKETNWYQGPSFLESLDSLENRKSSKGRDLLFPVQDIYKVDDKRIIAGRIESGCLEDKTKIRGFPNKQDTEVVSIEKFLEQPTSACAGESIGITTKDPAFINRGDVICSTSAEPVLTNQFRANIFWMRKKDFDKSKRIKIKCSTQETTCEIEAIEKRINSSTLEIIQENAQNLKNLEVGQVVIKTKKPLVVKEFSDLEQLGRFVLEEDENICAGGIITSINL